MFLNVIQRKTIFATVIAAAFFSACTQPQRTTAAPINAVVGTVDLIECVKLPPHAVLVVMLQDTSRVAAAQVVSQQAVRIENLQPPFKYTLPIEPSRINPAAQYTVSAHITDGAQPIFINDIVYPVLTFGAASKADIILVRTAS